MQMWSRVFRGHKVANQILRSINHSSISAVRRASSLTATTTAPIAASSPNISVNRVRVASIPDAGAEFITTPIFYVNGSPHLGHLHTAVLTDAYARWRRLKLGTNGSGSGSGGGSSSGSVWLSTGTDEHGLKVQDSARRAGVACSEWCTRHSLQFKSLFDRVGISYNDYIRTSEERHIRPVHTLWRQLRDGGYIYRGIHSGWYSKTDEAFVPESQLSDAPLPLPPLPSPHVGVTANSATTKRSRAKQSTTATATATATTATTTGATVVATASAATPRGKIVTETGAAVEWVEEVNYKFRLSAFQKPILDWLTAHPSVITPPSRYNAILSDVKDGLQDISVSRLRSKIEWAIPVPDDSEHSVYVWLDALTNYLTVTGYPGTDSGGDSTTNARLRGLWPAAVHVVGKDIIRFHAIYWPAFLLAAGLPLPGRIVAHGHWLVANQKMSKSLGNVVDPVPLLDRFGVDAIRYSLLRDGGLDTDSTFSVDGVLKSINSDLADAFGNCLLRITAPALLPDGRIPPLHTDRLTDHDRTLIDLMHSTVKSVSTEFDDLLFKNGLSAVYNLVAAVNVYFQQNEPWKQKTIDPPRMQTILYVAIEAIRIASILYQPIMPDAAERALTHLAVPTAERTIDHCRFASASSTRSGTPFGSSSIVLFTKHKPLSAATVDPNAKPKKSIKSKSKSTPPVLTPVAVPQQP